MNRLPVIARRRRHEATWWAPGLPVYAPDGLDTELADLVLADEARPCWHRRPAEDLEPEDGAMRWTPDQPQVRFPRCPTTRSR